MSGGVGATGEGVVGPSTASRMSASSSGMSLPNPGGGTGPSVT